MTPPALAVVVTVTEVDLGVVETVDSLRALSPQETLLLALAPLDARARPFLARLAERVSGRLLEIAGPAGSASARRAAMDSTTAPLVLFVDAGDRVDPTVANDLMVLLMPYDGGTPLALAAVRVEETDGRTRVMLPPPVDAPGLAAALDAMPSAILVSREAAEGLAWLANSGPALADADLALRALAAGMAPLRSESALVTRPLRVSRAAASVSDVRALFDAHAEVLAAAPAALLGAQERRLADLSSVHAPLAERRAREKDEIAALDAEIKGREGRLAEMGETGVDWGDLRETAPLSRDWGYDRGIPVDRPYIEAFLEAHAEDIQGVVLEVQEADYTKRFGGARVTRSEVVDVRAGNVDATVIADLRDAATLPDDAYDCFILTQTLHVLHDMEAAVRAAFRVLRPGGVLLATLPCTSRVVVEYGPRGDHWRVTEAAARELLARVFPAAEVQVTSFGNVLSSAAFLYGLGAHELTPEELAVRDPSFPLLVGVRARKPSPAEQPAAAATAIACRARVGRRGAAILMYHRVADPASDVHRLCVRPADFRTHMERLREAHTVVPLAELADGVRQGRVPDGVVALTFDDGYLDSLTAASPVLAELELPATFFVSAEHLDAEAGGEPWWDALERVLLGARPLPPAFELNGFFPLGRLDTSTAAARREAHGALHRRLVTAPADERRATLDRLLAWSGLPRGPVGSARTLTRAQLRTLGGRKGHAVGGHSVHHLALGHQPPAVVAREVAEGRRLLEDALGQPVTTFAYPYGDLSETAVFAVRDAGFLSAVSCAQETVTPGADVLRLPRYEITPGGVDVLDAILTRAFRAGNA